MKRATRVLLLVTQADWGGVQSFLVRFAQGLKREGREVLIAAGGEGRLFEEAANAGIPTHHLKEMRREISPLSDWKAIGEIETLIRAFKPDAIHLNSSKMGVLGAVAASRIDHASRPWTVYRIGGWAFLEPVGRLKQGLYRFAEKWSAHYKDVIVTVHPDDERMAHELGIKPRHRLMTIANGLDVETFEAHLLLRHEARQQLGIPDDAFVLGTVAG